MSTTVAEHTALKNLIAYLDQHSPFYQRLFHKYGISPEQIKTPDDLQKIPFTEKEDLQNFNQDFICVPTHKLVDYVTTSGTTGKPVTLALTDADLDRLALNEYNSFRIAGIHKTDVIQLMTTMDRRFMAGLAYFLGARKLGAGVIRVGNGLPELQWDTILSMRPSVLICVPSFLLRLIEYAESKGIDYKSSSVKKVICIGEAIRNPDFSYNALGKKISQKWDLALHSTYASSEMATAFTECEAFHGGHLQEDLLIAEIIDETGRVVKAGETGELVVTTLGIEGMPLLRFKTGDICVAHAEACSCGRNSLRLSPILGRKKQMIKYKGTTLYPNAIYDILENVELIKNYQVEVSTNTTGTDEIRIRIGVESDPGSKADELANTFRAKLRVAPKLEFLEAEKISALLQAGGSRKPLKFIDLRK